MTAPVYATEDQYETWTSTTAPANITQVLAVASRRIDEILIGVTYDVDDDEQPTDEAVAAVLADATCAQAQYLAETGDLSGATQGMASMSVGSVSWTRGTARTGGTMPVSAYSPVAVGILRSEGLFPVRAVRW